MTKPSDSSKPYVPSQVVVLPGLRILAKVERILLWSMVGTILVLAQVLAGKIVYDFGVERGQILGVMQIATALQCGPAVSGSKESYKPGINGPASKPRETAY